MCWPGPLSLPTNRLRWQGAASGPSREPSLDDHGQSASSTIALHASPDAAQDSRLHDEMGRLSNQRIERAAEAVSGSAKRVLAMGRELPARSDSSIRAQVHRPAFDATTRNRPGCSTTTFHPPMSLGRLAIARSLRSGWARWCRRRLPRDGCGRCCGFPRQRVAPASRGCRSRPDPGLSGPATARRPLAAR